MKTMTKSYFTIFTLCMALLCIGCTNKGEKYKTETQTQTQTRAKTNTRDKVVKVYLQPYNGFPEDQLLDLQADVQNCLDTLVSEKKFNVKTLQNRQLPASCFYQPRKRYRADSIIRYQLTFNNSNYIVGVISTDISCDAHAYEDFGILGLGFCPGTSAVVSTFRVKPKSMFYKVVVHEFLHNLGLDHCPQNDRSCYMCDADKVPQLEKEVWLCEACRETLINN